MVEEERVLTMYLVRSKELLIAYGAIYLAFNSTHLFIISPSCDEGQKIRTHPEGGRKSVCSKGDCVNFIVKNMFGLRTRGEGVKKLKLLRMQILYLTFAAFPNLKSLAGNRD